jgi:hypothetical protein
LEAAAAARPDDEQVGPLRCLDEGTGRTTGHHDQVDRRRTDFRRSERGFDHPLEGVPIRLRLPVEVEPCQWSDWRRGLWVVEGIDDVEARSTPTRGCDREVKRRVRGLGIVDADHDPAVPHSRPSGRDHCDGTTRMVNTMLAHGPEE